MKRDGYAQSPVDAPERNERLKKQMRASLLNDLRGRRTIACAAIGAVLGLLSFTSPVSACRSHKPLRKILLDVIPPAAEKSEVVAKVEILGMSFVRDNPRMTPLTTALARVTEPVRGTETGQIIEIFAQPSSCGDGYLGQHPVGSRGFIAGHFYRVGDKTLFEGRW